MSSLKKFDYRIKDNRKRNMFLCGIVLVVITIVGVKLFNSYATFSNETNELTMVNAKTKVYPTAVAKITELAKSSTNSDLRYDETEDDNLRYIGKNPNNYVKFNDEDWRIIGLMNNIEDAEGNKNTRVKLIKAEGIGQIAWDRRCDEIRSEDEPEYCKKSSEGNNNWEETRLQKLLNGPYLNSTVSDEYNRWTEALTGFGYGNSSAAINSRRLYEKIDFTNTGIKEKYRKMIDTVKYNLGGPNNYNASTNAYNNLIFNDIYKIERNNNNVYLGNKFEWIGKIGLMYASDYGLATSGGLGTVTGSEKEYNSTLEMCILSSTINWAYDSKNVGCRDNDWLYQGPGVAVEWTMTPIADNNQRVIVIYDSSDISGFYVANSWLVRPVLYLKPDVKITGGIGTEDNPFTLTI